MNKKETKKIMKITLFVIGFVIFCAVMTTLLPFEAAKITGCVVGCSETEKITKPVDKTMLSMSIVSVITIFMVGLIILLEKEQPPKKTKKIKRKAKKKRK